MHSLVDTWFRDVVCSTVQDCSHWMPQDVGDALQYVSRSLLAFDCAPIFHVIERQPLTNLRH
jgi:hypothetical protein